MMGRQHVYQHKMFVTGFNTGKRIRKEHILRIISDNIDFDFIYDEVRSPCGANGNVAVPPLVILEMMLQLILYNVRFKRGLVQTIPERLGWLWFLGFDLNEIEDSIMRKDTKSATLTENEIERNKKISKKRYIVEQYFGLSYLHDGAYKPHKQASYNRQ